MCRSLVEMAKQRVSTFALMRMLLMIKLCMNSDALGSTFQLGMGKAWGCFTPLKQKFQYSEYNRGTLFIGSKTISFLPVASSQTKFILSRKRCKFGVLFVCFVSYMRVKWQRHHICVTLGILNSFHLLLPCLSFKMMASQMEGGKDKWKFQFRRFLLPGVHMLSAMSHIQ